MNYECAALHVLVLIRHECPTTGTAASSGVDMCLTCACTAVHVLMLNSYGSYLPNNTLDQTYNGQPTLLYGAGGSPSFRDGNYPT